MLVESRGLFADGSVQVMLIGMLVLGRLCLSAGGTAHQWDLTLQEANDVVFVWTTSVKLMVKRQADMAAVGVGG